MKEIRDVKLSEFQKEIIDKLDDEYCYSIGDFKENEMMIFNKKMEHLITIDKEDNPKSIKDRIENCKYRIEKSLSSHNELVENQEKKLNYLNLY